MLWISLIWIHHVSQFMSYTSIALFLIKTYFINLVFIIPYTAFIYNSIKNEWFRIPEYFCKNISRNHYCNTFRSISQ